MPRRCRSATRTSSWRWSRSSLRLAVAAGDQRRGCSGTGASGPGGDAGADSSMGASLTTSLRMQGIARATICAATQNPLRSVARLRKTPRASGCTCRERRARTNRPIRAARQRADRALPGGARRAHRGAARRGRRDHHCVFVGPPPRGRDSVGCGLRLSDAFPGQIAASGLLPDLRYGAGAMAGDVVGGTTRPRACGIGSTAAATPTIAPRILDYEITIVRRRDDRPRGTRARVGREPGRGGRASL